MLASVGLSEGESFLVVFPGTSAGKPGDTEERQCQNAAGLQRDRGFSVALKLKNTSGEKVAYCKPM